MLRACFSSILLGVLLAGTLVTGSCRSTGTVKRPATIPSAEMAPPRVVQRLSSLYPELNRDWMNYRLKEGDQHRSSVFYALTSQLDGTCFSESLSPFGSMSTRTLPANRATELEVLSFLGLPDHGGKQGNQTFYVYYFWRSDTNGRWFAVAVIKDGLLESIGYNDATVGDFSKMQHYHTWADVLPASR